MQKMLRVLGDRRAALQNGEETQKGFTLIELLVVVIIIGVLAGIAIPVFLNQRESAWRAEVESDAKNAALAIETWAVDQGGTYTGLTDTVLDDLGFVESSDSTSISTAVIEGGNHFTVTAVHTELGQTLVYNSNLGGLQDWSETGGTGTGTGTE